MLLLQNRDSLFSKPKTQNRERVSRFSKETHRESWDEKPMIKHSSLDELKNFVANTFLKFVC